MIFNNNFNSSFITFSSYKGGRWACLDSTGYQKFELQSTHLLAHPLRTPTAQVTRLHQVQHPCQGLVIQANPELWPAGASATDGSVESVRARCGQHHQRQQGCQTAENECVGSLWRGGHIGCVCFNNNYCCYHYSWCWWWVSTDIDHLEVLRQDNHTNFVDDVLFDVPECSPWKHENHQ